MAIIQLLEHYRDLICPRCGSSLTVTEGIFCCTSRSCPYAMTPFPVIGGIPVLIDFEHSIVSAERLLDTAGSSQVDRARAKSRVRRWMASLGDTRNSVAKRHVSRMLTLLAQLKSGPERPVILVVGGGVIGSGLEDIYEKAEVDILAFDVYLSPYVQFIADGHSIPLAPETVDGVIVQAVLEHVLEPHEVVKEVHRVLKPGGLVYADTPFLQQVHEGAYDFTRFTDSGHRYLLREFECIDSGIVAGAGTQLMWSVDYFVRALTRSRRAGLGMRLALFWLRHLDRVLSPRYSIDSASSVYFLGRKSDSSMTPEEIIGYYQGAQ